MPNLVDETGHVVYDNVNEELVWDDEMPSYCHLEIERDYLGFKPPVLSELAISTNRERYFLGDQALKIQSISAHEDGRYTSVFVGWKGL